MKEVKVILRADGDTKMGFGHLYRLLAIGSYISADFRCILVTKSIDAHLADLYSKNNIAVSAIPFCNISDADELRNFIQPGDIVILDGYHFGLKYQTGVKEMKAKLICIDDVQQADYCADVIINHAGRIAPASIQVTGAASEIFTGSEYALLRKEFLEKARQPASPFRNNLFICLGGADTENKLPEVINDVLALPHKFYAIHVAAGAAYPSVKWFQREGGQNENLKIYRTIETVKLLEIMAQCSFAICTPSTVAYEYCCCKGILFLLQAAENQRHICNYLVKEGMALEYEKLNTILTSDNKIAGELYPAITRKQQQHFDGRSGERVLRIVKKLWLKDNVKIRKAREKDVDLIFHWANDRILRANSINPEPIPYETHVNWFRNKISSPHDAFYVAESKEGTPLGYIRFQISDAIANLSYYVDEKFRGLGKGAEVIRLGTAALLKDFPKITTVEAFVKKTNIPSLKSFKALGYEEVEIDDKHLQEKGFKRLKLTVNIKVM